MSSLSYEGTSSQSTMGGPHEAMVGRVLVLVQNHLIISTFPEQEVEGAIDLARVLCRALAQSVDLFRLQTAENICVQVGTLANSGCPEWVHLVHVRLTFLKGVKVEVYDPTLADSVVRQHPRP